jgi:glucose-1-phosphate adenylyltransferase
MDTDWTTRLPRTQAFVLAGGQGERLFPLTVSRPKPAIPFGGVARIVDFTLSNCLKSNACDVALLTQYRHDELHTYIRQRWGQLWNSPEWSGRRLTCLPPASGKRYRGTADAVFQNISIIHSNGAEYVLILSGDHVYEMDYRELLAQHVKTNADVTIATVEHPIKDATHFGVVEVDHGFRVTGFQEKPMTPRGLPSRPHLALISMGIYVFTANVLSEALMAHCDSACGYDFGHNIIPCLVRSARVHAYDFRDEAQDAPRYWRDIGTIDSYYDASMDVAHGRAPLKRMLPLESRALLSASAHVSHSVLSPGVHIQEGAWVEDSVLMPGVRIGRGVRLRRAIIGEGVHVPASFQVGLDIEHDRKYYTVSRNGIVVLSETPKTARPTLVPFKSSRVSRQGRTVA